MNQKLLFVGEDPVLIGAVESLLKHEPIETYWFQSPLKALESITLIAPQVILSSQDMPEMDGVPFLDAVGNIFPDSVRMIMGGYVMPDYAKGAVLNGYVTKFLPQPWSNATLLYEIRTAFINYESANDTVRVNCAVCGDTCTTEANQAASAFFLCESCKTQSKPTADELLRMVAGFTDTTH